MKTIKRIFLSVITLCLFSLVLTSCFTSSTKSIKIVKIPNSVFEVVDEGDSKAVPDLMIVEVTDDVTTQIKLSIDENGQLVSSNNVFTITINGFDLSKVGSFTASVEYAGVVSYFDYQVVSKDSYFAGGDGSVNNPYQITTAEQFINMNNVDTTNKYFKLMNDIDFSSVTNRSYLKESSLYFYYVSRFYGTLDGNNKKIYNFDDTDDTNNNLGKLVALFSTATNATIKDVDFYVSSVGNIEYGGISIVYTGRKVNFENVNMYGTCINMEQNVSLYVTNAYSNVSFVNCDNYVDIIATDGNYVGGFVGVPRNANLYFENSFYYGYMEAQNVGAFVCNGYGHGTIKYVNSGNKGTLSSISSSKVLCAISENNIATDEASSGLVTGTIKQIPAFDFKAMTKLSDNKMLVINKVNEESEIVSVKVTLSFRWMTEQTGGTNTAFMSKEFDVNSTTDLETQVYLNSLVNGEPTIKVVHVADYEKGEGQEEIIYTDWLKYNVEQGVYVFDGSNIYDNETYINFGNPAITIVSYNANGEVVSAAVRPLKLA